MTKSISGGLAAHLQGTQTTLATCWRVARKDGALLGFTDHDQSLTIDGLVYQASSGLDRSALDTEAGPRVGTLEVTALLTSDAVTPDDLLGGKYQGAEVWVFRVNWANTDQGPLRLMRGWIGRVTLKDQVFVAELEGLSKKLTQEIVELYTAECLADLGDERCRAGAAVGGPYTATSAIASVVDDRIFAAGLSEADDWWRSGLVTWTSGPGAGLTSDIRSYTIGRVELMTAPALGMTAGATFTIGVGCDKKLETCRTKFNNVVNFRGFGVLMPGTDELFWYPDAKT